jgi:hypothetical protein
MLPDLNDAVLDSFPIALPELLSHSLTSRVRGGEADRASRRLTSLGPIICRL